MVEEMEIEMQPRMENIVVTNDANSTGTVIEENEIDTNVVNVEMEICDGCCSSSASTVDANFQIASGEHFTSDMSNKTPIEFFDLFFTTDILSTIVEQTNIYATQHYRKIQCLPLRSRLHQWKKEQFSIPELMKFIASIIIMGIVRYPKIEDHWAQQWPYSSTVGKIMTRDRFSLILKFFHLNDSEKYIKKGEPGHDSLYKIRLLLDPLLQNFKKNYIQNRELSLDEAMVGFKGRIWFLTYMPKKPTKWGMKAFSLADAITGYRIMYTGILCNYVKVIVII